MKKNDDDDRDNVNYDDNEIYSYITPQSHMERKVKFNKKLLSNQSNVKNYYNTFPSDSEYNNKEYRYIPEKYSTNYS